MMPELLTWLICISSTLTLLALLHILSTKTNLKFPFKIASSLLPPGPKPLPIIGNLLLLGDNPHRSLARLAKSYGPVMSLKLGQVTTIVISSTDLAREVLNKKDVAFCGRSVPDCLRALNHHETSLIWVHAHQQWKNLRIICTTQLFTSQRLDDNKGLRQRKIRELVDYLRECSKAREAVDVGRVVFNAVMNSLSNTLVSVDLVDPSYKEESQDFRDLIWRIHECIGSPNISDFFPVLRVLDLQGKRRQMEGYMKRLHEVFDGIIDQRLKSMELNSHTKNIDFLDTLIQHEKNLDRHQMKTLLMELLAAGSETSANTVEWAMAELLANPSTMAKMRTELAKAFEGDKEVDESDILRLPYLQAVVKETLRLHPPVPFLVPRETEMDIELCQYMIPKNTRVLVNYWAISRDEIIWRDAEVFMPKRFLERDTEYKGRDFELIPFGAGRRICPGLPLASRMVHLILASLLKSFEWKLTNGMKPEDVELTEKYGVTLALAKPILAIPHPNW